MTYIVLGLPLFHIAALSSLTLKMYSWVHILIATLFTINNIVKEQHLGTSRGLGSDPVRALQLCTYCVVSLIPLSFYYMHLAVFLKF